MSLKRKRMDKSVEEPNTKRLKINDHTICSKLFTDEYDKTYFRQTYKAIAVSNVTRSENVPMDIIKTIAEFASGFFVKCDNFNHCGNKILPSQGDVDFMKSEINNIDFNKIYEDYLDTDISQLDVVNDEAQKYVQQFGYFFVNWFNQDKDKYFCSDCINKKGDSHGLNECQACLNDWDRINLYSRFHLIIWNEGQDCSCGHYAIYCDKCNDDESRYCNICQETKCHINDDVKLKCEDQIECHQQFDCNECDNTLCSAGKSLDEIQTKCDIRWCYSEICMDCVIPIYCLGCGDQKCVTHKSCYEYEEKLKESSTKCSNTKCQYNHWKNGPLYKLWFGRNSN
eukprot:444845_1